MERCVRLNAPPPAPPKKIYLASPYSARLPDGARDTGLTHRRFRMVSAAAGLLMRRGFLVFSPISHSVPIADEIGDHLDYDFWLAQDFAFIHWCDELWIYKIPGWDKSIGVAREIKYAQRLCKPVRFLELEVSKDGATKEPLVTDFIDGNSGARDSVSIERAVLV